MPPSSPLVRLWPLAAWVSGAILVLTILLALGATVWRMEQTYKLVDSDITSAEDYMEMIDRSLHWTRIGLYIGAPAALAYLTSLVMLHRSKNRGKRD